MYLGLLASDLSHRHGWAHHCLSLIRALQRAGVQMTVITSHNSPDVDGIEQHRLLPDTNPMQKNLLLHSLLRAPEVGRLLRDCDVIHAMIEPYAPVGAWIAAGRPFVVTAHGSYIDLLMRRRKPVGTIYRWSFKRALPIVCVSHYTARVIGDLLPDARLEVINNAVDPAQFANLSKDAVQKRGPTVLAVGAVKLRKGTLELVRAMPAVRAAVPDVQCVIIGSTDAEPGYSHQVAAEINVLGLQDCVHLLGHVSEETKLAWYGAADVFALPSMNVGRKFEGFGLIYLEASASGLPVIGTRGSGAEDAIEHGVTGLLVPQSGVTGALADAIISLLRDPARASQMGAVGRASVQNRTWDSAAQQWLALYETLS
ncbi:MAG TPA: glycosyltransferase family 4 protein [Spirillospora sp.]|nr:glycosyltransferase family 4 protein [Spirillospora sp.]